MIKTIIFQKHKYLIVKSITQFFLAYFSFYYYVKNKNSRKLLLFQSVFEFVEIIQEYITTKYKTSLTHHVMSTILPYIIYKNNNPKLTRFMHLCQSNQFTGPFGFNMYKILINTRYEYLQNMSVFLQMIFIRMPIILKALYCWAEANDYKYSKTLISGYCIGLIQLINEILWIKWGVKLRKEFYIIR